MSLKWIGAMLVIAGCGGFGFLLAMNYKRETAILRHLVWTLAYMSSELAYRQTPLPELCRRAAGQNSGCLKTFFETLDRELESQISPDAASCVSAAADRTPELPKRTRNGLISMGRSLGEFDLTGQLKGLEAVRVDCSRELEELERNRTQRLRSYQTLGLCAGAALAILFI